MDLYLVRHAVAEEASAGGGDVERRLTKEGRERFAQAVRGLERAGVKLDAIQSSPLVRALETAKLMRPLLEGEIRERSELAEPPGPQLLEGLEGERLALVGHEPHMSELLAWLVTGQTHAGERFKFKKGAVAWLDGPPRPGAMRLRAFLHPAFLERLGD